MRLLGAIITFFMLTSWASALEFKYVDNMPDLILVQGPFEADDNLDTFVNMVRAKNIKLVTFNSNGGNTYKSFELGRLIRRLGLDTVQLRSNNCESACAFAFMGGVNRNAQPGSIGIHQSAFTSKDIETDVAVIAIQLLVADIVAYHTEMGIDPSILHLMMSTPNSDIRYLSVDEMVRFKMITIDPRIAPTQVVEEEAEEDEEAPAEGDLEASVRAFPIMFLDAWANPDVNLNEFIRLNYSPKTKFYTRDYNHAEIVKDKGAVAKRWPVRIYAVRDDETRVWCSSSICTVSTLVDWYVFNPKTKKSSSGTSRFEYVLDRNSETIVEENGEAISTDKGNPGMERVGRTLNKELEACSTEQPNANGYKPACVRAKVIYDQIDRAKGHF